MFKLYDFYATSLPSPSISSAFCVILDIILYNCFYWDQVFKTEKLFGPIKIMRKYLISLYFQLFVYSFTLPFLVQNIFLSLIGTTF